MGNVFWPTNLNSMWPKKMKEIEDWVGKMILNKENIEGKTVAIEV